ncbi:hypothetical protein EI555_014643, partial [Monodon monoceros]
NPGSLLILKARSSMTGSFCWISSSCQHVFRNQRACLPSVMWFLTRSTNPNCQCELWILGFYLEDQTLLQPLQILEGKPLVEEVY